jgi:Tfp pilus assembly protein PilN
MIKINLAKPQRASGGGPVVGGADGIEGFSPISDEDIRKQAITRLLLMGLFPAVLIAWEFQSLPAKKSELTIQQARIADINQQNQKAQEAVEQIKKLEVDEKKFQSQIDVIESIKKGRMQEVKFLDSIQRMTPSKVWLQKLDYSSEKLNLAGFAMTDGALTGFMDALGRSIFFKDVNLVRSTEQLEDSTGLTVKRFEVSCAVEKVQ